MLLEFNPDRFAHLRDTASAAPNPTPRRPRGTPAAPTAPLPVRDAVENTHTRTTPLARHAAQPVDSDDIRRVSEYFTERGKWRDNMLFIMGINTGLRVSDLLDLRFESLIASDKTWRRSFLVWDRKTRNTKKEKLVREITINDAMKWCVQLYLEHTPDVSLSDYMFRSESNHGGNRNQPLHRNNVSKILKDAMAHIDPDKQISSHTMRKTFGNYHRENAANADEMMYILQKTFGHSSEKQTLEYIGITDKMVASMYTDYNIGLPEDDKSGVNEESEERTPFVMDAVQTNIG